MSTRTIEVTDKLYSYMLDVSLREPDVMAELRKLTARHPMSMMQISPEQAQFMQMLVRMLGAKRCIEVGTFTGYSALAVALALPKKGKLVALDISDEYTQIGVPFWEKAGVAKKIDLRIGPAKKTLNKMIKKGEQGRYAFAFIDADKPGYPDYFDRCLKLLRTGGVIAVDNIFMNGDVADGRKKGENPVAMRAFNEMLKNDKRVDLSLVPIGDGLTLAMKK
jgi:predicted O-methyltransferase YrrM